AAHSVLDYNPTSPHAPPLHLTFLFSRPPPPPTLFPYTNALPICRLCTSRSQAHRARHSLRPGERSGRVANASAQRYRPQRSRSRSEEHTSELQSRENLVCRLLLEKKKFEKTV